MSKQFLSKFNTVWNNKCSSYKKLPSVLPATRRIIVIGDIHGDFNVLKKCLDMAGLINRKNQWIGGDTVVVVEEGGYGGGDTVVVVEDGGGDGGGE